jgi:hypothetical protein
MSQGLRLLFAGALLVLLAGCAHTPFSKPSPRITSDHRELPGILETAYRRNLDRVAVFVTHGMGFTRDCFADEVAEMLDGVRRKTCRPPTRSVPVCLEGSYSVRGESLPPAGLDIGSRCRRHVRASSGNMVSAFGRLGVQQLTATYRGRSFDVRLYSYFWNDDAMSLQQYHISEDIAAGSERTSINRDLKYQTINGGFSDAVLYAGSFGPVMREGMRSALCLMALDAAGHITIGANEPITISPCAKMTESGTSNAFTSTHLALLTSSLGSRMLFDALSEAGAPGSQPLSRAIDEHSPVIYMAANQLPLLAMSQFEVTKLGPSSSRAGVAEIGFLQRYLTQDGGRVIPNSLGAFYDPNDLLGYRAGSHLPPSMRRNIIEVTQYYARRWFLFADPREAHAKSFMDEDARRFIVCGAVQPGNRLVPRSC